MHLIELTPTLLLGDGGLLIEYLSYVPKLVIRSIEPKPFHALVGDEATGAWERLRAFMASQADRDAIPSILARLDALERLAEPEEDGIGWLLELEAKARESHAGEAS